VAVADIIDNSIDAKARHVVVRLIARTDGKVDLVIWDDGCGMSSGRLKEAMRFGSSMEIESDMSRLGKFGLGLKLASLSQARELRVVSRSDRELSGRAWLETGIARGFICTVYEQRECLQLLRQVVPDRPLQRAGTVVWWSHLYRVAQRSGDAQHIAQRLLKRLKDHLALAFHRFLAKGKRKIDIEIEIFDQAQRSRGLPAPLTPLDPFGYPVSGVEGFPTKLVPPDVYKNRMALVAHIWPPNSSAPEYKLPGGVNGKQGFYFYRNDRLIQGGGWNGRREAEPHLGLARIAIDLDPSVDVDVGLDVKKVTIELPDEYIQAIEHAESPEGVSFKQYLSLAQAAYRKRQLTEAELPLIPSDGLPADLTAFLHKELRIKRTTKHRDLKFRWAPLSKSTFFAMDRDAGVLTLNRVYRRALLNGLPGSSADVPVVKCLLFLALRDALASQRLGPNLKEQVDQVNRILVRAVRHERIVG
jgi:hypothetical protein